MGRKIEHQEAIRSQAAERYVAHELSPAEQQAFEAHFFECPECAQEVRLELTFAANMRAVARELRDRKQPSPEPAKTGLWQNCVAWLRFHPVAAFSLAANLLLAAGLGYVMVRSAPDANAPRLVAAYFAPGPTHGAADVHMLAPGETIYQVRFLIPGQKSPAYAFEILDAAGKRESSGSLPAPAGGEDSLNLQVPVDSLPSGVHVLVVRGEPGRDIVSWSKFRTSHR